jgi:hypothetical protein
MNRHRKCSKSCLRLNEKFVPTVNHPRTNRRLIRHYPPCLDSRGASLLITPSRSSVAAHWRSARCRCSASIHAKRKPTPVPVASITPANGHASTARTACGADASASSTQGGCGSARRGAERNAITGVRGTAISPHALVMAAEFVSRRGDAESNQSRRHRPDSNGVRTYKGFYHMDTGMKSPEKYVRIAITKNSKGYQSETTVSLRWDGVTTAYTAR